ncbi:MAG: hypothetical protein KKD31_18655 [Bacteroidetes bacterium]|nr:hypothetical protein [Bacteroidota bacterium]
MKIFEANISYQAEVFLSESLKNITSFEIANQKLSDVTGITHFFENESDFVELIQLISNTQNSVAEEPDRAEYGDFQTNANLANKATVHLSLKNVSPEIVIEPTCGKGSFIVASLSNFKGIKTIFGIEIYRPYVWETKFNILDFFLSNKTCNKPEIVISHCNVFDFDFKKIARQFAMQKILVIGNPPWVTNSKLGSLNSANLPKKSNFKKQNGLDAMTGKGNFDIAEYITMMLFDAFHENTGHLSLLVKNSVIKNIVFDQKSKQYRIGEIEKHCIDSKKEFNASVEASLLYCRLNSAPGFECREFDFYSTESKLDFGWANSKFVSNISEYIETSGIDGICPFEWRQGIKHDCSSVMELEKVNGHYVNNRSEEIFLEEDLVYGFLKSSDLKNTVIINTRKHTIVTQTKVGQETAYIQHSFPKTYEYLIRNLSDFQSRKSSIYRGKPRFSIFGIGEYSFKPYKIAISGLYKTFHFTLVLPQNGKPVMLDDTCYFIGFDRIEFAVFAIILLNSKTTKEFLQSITFSDSKRVFTKDLLMRIDFFKLVSIIPQEEIDEQIIRLNKKYDLKICLSSWENFLQEIKPTAQQQLSMF